MRLPIEEHNGFVFDTLVMIRNPLERIRSVYEFEKQQEASTPGAVHAKKFNFRDYVEWRMQPHVAPTIRNMHVRYLTKNTLPRSEALSNEYLEVALSSIKDNPYVGVVDLFDKSIGIWAQRFSEKGIKIDFKYKRQNVSTTKKSQASNKLQQLEEDLGDELFELVVSQNAFDIKIYEFARDMVNQRYNELKSRLKHDKPQKKNVFAALRKPFRK
jgi:hypothetical protein